MPDVKADDAPEAESVEDEAAVVAPGVSLPTLNGSSAMLEASLPVLNPVTLPQPSPQTSSTKDAKGDCGERR